MRISMKSPVLVCCTLWIGALFSLSAHAEYGCQSGFVPVYQGNRQVCVADYNLSVWKQQGQQQHQQKAAEMWEDRYGAIARAPNGPNYFFSVDQVSEDSAKDDALNKCGSGCKITGTFRNGCTALTWGGGASYFESAEKKKQSESKALRSCRVDSKTECKLIFSACSLPVRVQ